MVAFHLKLLDYQAKAGHGQNSSASLRSLTINRVGWQGKAIENSLPANRSVMCPPKRPAEELQIRKSASR
jgi:hypothetical protein